MEEKEGKPPLSLESRKNTANKNDWKQFEPISGQDVGWCGPLSSFMLKWIAMWWKIIQTLNEGDWF